MRVESLFLQVASASMYMYDCAALGEMRPGLHYELFLRPEFYKGLATSLVSGSANICL